MFAIVIAKTSIECHGSKLMGLMRRIIVLMDVLYR